jgi:3-hydroxyisobutyrate dehydrogenase-like beta-hydroxyacid dehydrogenase
MEDAGDLDTLVGEASVLLSILVPAQAEALAERVAPALQRTATPICYVESNAIAPGTVLRIASTLSAAGATMVDAGIVGGPPGAAGPGPRLYASGDHLEPFTELAHYGLDIRPIAGGLGAASALKMCYAALTKGLTALMLELLAAAHTNGIDVALQQELLASQPELLAWITRQAPSVPAKAHRWVGEMEEIAATFASAGLPPDMGHGAAELYRLLAASAVGQAAVAGEAPRPSLEQVVAALSR